jgi:hypothetical protein
VRGEEVYLPLYESKMIHQFDHRHGTFEGQSPEEVIKGFCREPSTIEYNDPKFTVEPRYWVSEAEVERAVGKTKRYWFISFRDVTRAVDRRTATFAVLPWSAIGNQLPVILFAYTPVYPLCAFLANVNSFAFDFVARQKVGGIHMNFFIVKQLPVLPPDCYTPTLLNFIVPRVVELTYTAWDLAPFAQDVLAEAGQGSGGAGEQGSGGAGEQGSGGAGEQGRTVLLDALLRQWMENWQVAAPPPLGPAAPLPPFRWDEERRAALRAELDALYAHLYGLTREELAYIMDTFPIVRRKDEKQWGEYRTKRLVLENYDALEGRFE